MHIEVLDDEREGIIHEGIIHEEITHEEITHEEIAHDEIIHEELIHEEITIADELLEMVEDERDQIDFWLE